MDSAVYYQGGIKERPWGRTKQQDISQPSQRGATGRTEPGSHPKDGTLKISWESALHMGWLCVLEGFKEEEVTASGR